MRVTMAVNNDSGVHSGIVYMIDFELDGDIALWLECEDGQPCVRDLGNKQVRIGKKAYSFMSYTTWAGNMALDCMGVSEETAIQLAEDLRASGLWNCNQAYTFIFDAWNEGKPITFDEGFR